METQIVPDSSGNPRYVRIPPRRARSSWPKRIRNAAILVILTALAVFVLWLVRSQAPSAQCKRQYAQVASLQADAVAAQNSPLPDWSRFNADAALSGAILGAMRSEHCPKTGYTNG